VWDFSPPPYLAAVVPTTIRDADGSPRPSILVGGTSTSTLCQVLPSLGIEAEIWVLKCGRVSGEYPIQITMAILVDWDQEVMQISLLKTVREQKVASPGP